MATNIFRLLRLKLRRSPGDLCRCVPCGLLRHAGAGTILSCVHLGGSASRANCRLRRIVKRITPARSTLFLSCFPGVLGRLASHGPPLASYLLTLPLRFAALGHSPVHTGMRWLGHRGVALTLVPL